MKEFGGGDITFLSGDGEVIIFVVVGEPILLEGKYKGKPSDKIAAPVVTDEGFQLFICGKRLARKIGKRESDFKTTAFMAIRHGLENDINSSYELRVFPDAEKTKELFAIAKRDFKPEQIAEAVDAARDVMNG